MIGTGGGQRRGEHSTHSSHSSGLHDPGQRQPGANPKVHDKGYRSGQNPLLRGSCLVYPGGSRTSRQLRTLRSGSRDEVGGNTSRPRPCHATVCRVMHQAGLHVPLLHRDYFLRAQDQAHYHAERRTLANRVLEQERLREEQRERQITTIQDPQQTHMVRIKKPEAEPIPIEAIRKALGQIALEARLESLPKLHLEPSSQILTTATTTVTTVAPKAAKQRRLDDPSITNPVPRVEEPQPPKDKRRVIDPH